MAVYGAIMNIGRGNKRKTMLKLNIFILEDAPERIEYFKKQFENHNLTIFSIIDDTVYYNLKDNKYDIFFLDHDLESHLLRTTEKNGYDFAYFLTVNNLQSHAIIYIHSMNPIGANNMLKLFQKANYEVQWIPYHLLKQSGEKI